MEPPNLPVPLAEFIPYLGKQTREDILDGTAMAPFKEHDSRMREAFAQQPDNKIIADPHVNVVPVYTGFEGLLATKARDIAGETQAEKDKYLLPLTSTFRRENGTSSIVPSLEGFKSNFRLFSESSLVDLDWSNVVVAGSAVTTCLLPLSEQNNSSRKALREHYHEKIAPASDVDLFIYGLNEEQAIEKIKQIEKCIRNSILEEITVIRTKNALTIASKYPTRHVQIVLRLYKSVSEILTGFDVDCSCTAFDGSQVWASPRALASFATQANTIDLTRRSPSYENRLAKYSHRGFEVYWQNLDRSRIDPTIFERSFNHVAGLARLLVMEKLPTAISRDKYIEKRRTERDRPASLKEKFYRSAHGNLKEYQPEDVAEWVEEEDVSNYHTFTIPYGPKYSSKKIERLLYKKDLLLNAEWNKSKERTVNLHRHPAFFGSVDDVVEDCCGSCPVPTTPEDIEVAEVESKRFISGKMQFMKDDPGRQAIGSFNPITDTDWAEMAYIGDTTRLCQAIVDKDLEVVKECCAQEGFNVDRRDHTGRMPLHLAIMCSTPEIVQCLVDSGARLVARVAGGYTALHLAAARGHPDILRSILRKSEANKAEELELSENNGKRTYAPTHGRSLSTGGAKPENMEYEDDEISVVQTVSEGPDAASEGSMVVIQNYPSESGGLPAEADEEMQPNFYETVDVVSWDTPLSPLQLAILNGHAEIVDILATEFGANPALPVVWKYCTYNNPKAILSMTLAACNPREISRKLIRTLLELGVSSTQADMNHITAFHSIVMEGDASLLDTIFEVDGPAAQLAIGYPAMAYHMGTLPLLTAIRYRGIEMIKKLISHGANVSLSAERTQRVLARWKSEFSLPSSPREILMHPLIAAAIYSSPRVIEILLNANSDPNAMTPGSIDKKDYSPGTDFEFPYGVFGRRAGTTVLDIIDCRIQYLQDREGLLDRSGITWSRAVPKLKPDSEYFKGLIEGGYEYTYVQCTLERAKIKSKDMDLLRDSELKQEKERDEKNQKTLQRAAIELESLEGVRALLVQKGAKTYDELYPLPKRESTSVPEIQKPEIAAASTDKEFVVSHKFCDLDGCIVDNAGYMPLFEASWNGDITKVKGLILESRKTSHKEKKEPLRVSVKDEFGLSPFTIAVARGHFKLAEIILEIVDSQYTPRPNAQLRKAFEVVIDDEESQYRESEMEDDSEAEENAENEENDHGVSVRFNFVNEQKTIDDVRELGHSAKSSVSPLSVINSSCQVDMIFGTRDIITKPLEKIRSILDINQPELFKTVTLTEYAAQHDDLAMFRFVMNQESKYQRCKEDYDGACWHEFRTAMRHGSTSIMGYLISTMGTQFPFRSVMKKAGIEPQSNLKYYQGLTVYGKKRKDWAAECGHRDWTVDRDMNLLLAAAYDSNLESIKWFLSDRPEQKYREFAANHPTDKRLEAFEKIPGGFEEALSSWIRARRDLVLHCAVLGSNSKASGNAHVNYILDAAPGSLNAKNIEGITPLHIAFLKRRIMAAKSIVERGADQTARDKEGRNCLHYILCSYPAHRNICKSKALFQTLSKILDGEVLCSLATQRSNVRNPSGTSGSWGMKTPLAEWLGYVDDSQAELLDVILQSTGGRELRILDGEGNYPIHQVVRAKRNKLACVMLARDPNLALLENATGITPLELAENKLLRAILSSIKKNSEAIVERNGYRTAEHRVYWREKSEHGYYPYQKILDFDWTYKQEDYDGPQFLFGKNEENELYHTLRDVVANNQVKRTLVSLQDANQLVKRLSGRSWKRPQAYSNEDSIRDEVTDYITKREAEDCWEMTEILDREKEESIGKAEAEDVLRLRMREVGWVSR